MRLIDADTLKEKFDALAYDDWNQGTGTTWANAFSEAADIVENMPTIEPERKKGNWVGIDDIPHEVWECDRCGHIYEYEDDPDELPNFCPSCGADMRGEQG